MLRAWAAAVAVLIILVGCEGPGGGVVVGTPVASNPIYAPTPRVLTAAELADLEAMIALAVGTSAIPDSPGQFWSLVIDGYRDPAGGPVRYVAGEIPNTVCAQSSDPREYANNALYCPPDETIAYDHNFLKLLYGQVGSGAPLAFISHEWGHHVQKLVGFPDVAKATELQADCFAGLYLGWLHGERGRLTEAQLVDVANNFFYIGDDVMGGFYSHWYDEGVHGNGNQRRMAYVVGFDGASYAHCAAYGGWSEPAAIPLSPGRWLVPAPGLTATEQQFGTYRALKVADREAEALVIADLDFSTTDPAAAMSSALQVLGLDQQPALKPGAVTPGWLSAIGGASGSAVSMSYSLPVADGTVHGIVLVHIATDGNGMIWNIGSTTPGAELSLLNVMNAGYCEQAAPVFGACPVPVQ